MSGRIGAQALQNPYKSLSLYSHASAPMKAFQGLIGGLGPYQTLTSYKGPDSHKSRKGSMLNQGRGLCKPLKAHTKIKFGNVFIF